MDARRKRGAGILYPSAYLFAALAPALVYADRATLSWLFALALGAYAWSALRVATGRHYTFERWLAALMPPEFRPGARATFGYLCAWLLPLWLLTLFTVHFPTAGAGAYGLTLTALAAAYLAGARALRRAAPEQGAPWLLGGAILSVTGPLLALGAPWPRLAAIILALAVYGAAAIISRRPPWAYGVAFAVPALAYALCDRLNIPPDAYELGVLPAALLLLAAGDGVRARGLRRAWSRPFDVVGHGLLALLLLYTVVVILFASDGQDRDTVTATALVYTVTLIAHASWRKRGSSAWYGVGFGLASLQS